MAEEKFDENLLRATVAHLHVLCGLFAAHEMFGKGYFSLGVMEKGTVDQTVFGMVASNYQALTPESLVTQKVQQPVGFRAPTDDKS